MKGNGEMVGRRYCFLYGRVFDLYIGMASIYVILSEFGKIQTIPT